MSGRQHKVMVQPINVIFRHLQQQSKVSLWLYDNTEFRLEGKIIVCRRFADHEGFDEFMNVTLAEAEEVQCAPGKERKELARANTVGITGRILLKGDNITLIQPVL
ncbi:Sme1p [Malassezia vespertilionis]|uniref:Small nuclear ribonucleoprotein E n=1 Tax=Malassezia vespertilionis TaxID=2020962 RepID=A0A2N1J8G7_9BASI|nr:Sme1p [Malassezia vespertilionis]